MGMSKSLAAIGMVLALITFAISGCGGGGDDGGSSPPQKTSSADAAAHKQTSSSPSGDDETDLARKTEKKISLKGTGFPCHWAAQSSDLVHLASCKKHEILLATATDSNAINLWAESMDDQLDSGWMVVGDHYAVVSPDHGTINRVMDLLGGDGAVKSLG